MIDGVSESRRRHGKCAAEQGGLLQRVVLRPISERHNYSATTSFPKLSDYALEEEKLRKLYDQARTQGNKKKKKEYKEKIAELNRLHKSEKRESKRSKS
jgi:CRISPR/Cas system CSM-associated protein Csm2 small subunit